MSHDDNLSISAACWVKSGIMALFVRSVLFICYIIINLLDGEGSLCVLAACLNGVEQGSKMRHCRDVRPGSGCTKAGVVTMTRLFI